MNKWQYDGMDVKAVIREFVVVINVQVDVEYFIWTQTRARWMCQPVMENSRGDSTDDCY